MTVRQMRLILKKCKALLLAGERGDRLAQSLKVAPSTAYGYIKQLEFLGEIVDITGDPKSTPRIWADGRKKPVFSTPPDAEKTEMVVPSSNADAAPRPTKTVRAHCTGAYVVEVKTLGEHVGTIKDKDGFTLGDFGPLTNVNGSTRQYGMIRLYPGEDLHFTLYHAKRGPKLTVTPNPRYVYYKTADVEGRKLLTDQVNALLNVLVSLGWEFAAPTFNGVEHWAIDSPELAPLLKYADRHADNDGWRVHTDASHGSPEVEVYNDHDGAINDVITLNEIPEHFDRIDSTLCAITRALAGLSSSVGQLTAITAQLTQAQTDALKSGFSAFSGEGYQ